MHVDVITIFPELFRTPLETSILGRAVVRGLLTVNVVNLRDFTHDRHRSVDDRPYGGGAGMLMMPGPLFEAVEHHRKPDSHVVLTSPQGEPLTQPIVQELAARERLMVVCGHYEGVDERVRDALIDQEISIGDYILSNGNLPALVMLDAVARLLPGALGCAESAVTESFGRDGLLEYPQYTRPESFRGMRVPEVLLSGDHARIAAWRREQQRERTRRRRPDLAAPNELTDPIEPEN